MEIEYRVTITADQFPDQVKVMQTTDGVDQFIKLIARRWTRERMGRRVDLNVTVEQRQVTPWEPYSSNRNVTAASY